MLNVKCSPWEDRLAVRARSLCRGEQLRPWVPSASSWPLGPVASAVCPPFGITSLECEVAVHWPSLHVQPLLSGRTSSDPSWGRLPPAEVGWAQETAGPGA